MVTRLFNAKLTDSDGEEHEYYFRAPTLWHVTTHIHATIMAEGDFYGHQLNQTMNLEVTELVANATAALNGVHVIEVPWGVGVWRK